MHDAIAAVLCGLVGILAVALYVIGVGFVAADANPPRRLSIYCRLRDEVVPRHLFNRSPGGGPAPSRLNG
jgi:hypothetical protein